MGNTRGHSDYFPGKEPGTKGGRWADFVGLDRPSYETIQRCEGCSEQTGTCKGIETIAMELVDEAEDDLENGIACRLGSLIWHSSYAHPSRHLEMLSMCRGYQSSTRYKKLNAFEPCHLVIREYSTTDLPVNRL